MNSLSASLKAIEIAPSKRSAARPAAVRFSIAPKQKLEITGFCGLSKNNVLEMSRKSEEKTVSNGMVTTMMRHRVKKGRLGRDKAARKALLRGLTTDVLYYGRIRTTVTKAKAVRPYVEKMIGLAKKGGPHNKKQCNSWLYDSNLADQLFENVPDIYGDRPGGYTRLKVLDEHRRGDNAPMAEISLV